ncbi:Small nuclear ribonucleoprotein-associated protein B [Diplonema papillatum]|nr:Small nuclear ribonucleoprotein-associated protein B [Diplonema papillatum]
MLSARKGKLFDLLNQKIRCSIGNERTLVGKFVSFDRHMNIVLSGGEEYKRSIKTGEDGDTFEVEQRRDLGLVFVRGESVQSIIVDKLTKKHKKKKKKSNQQQLLESTDTPSSLAGKRKARPDSDLDEPPQKRLLQPPPALLGLIPPGPIPAGLMVPPGFLPH